MAKRKSKLPIASAGRIPDFRISKDDWARIENECGVRLSDQLRLKIREITQEFLALAEFEHTAPNVGEAEEGIKSIKDAIGALRNAILRRPPSVSGRAHFYAKQLICEQANLQFEDGKDGLTRFAWTTLLELSRACDAARAELVEQKQAGGSFSSGTAWNLWMRKLATAMNQQGLSVTVRKDTDKQKSGMPSPFVAFVWELQQHIPGQFRRSTQSPEALAQAINRARVKTRDK